jgi:hypothetical protein
LDKSSEQNKITVRYLQSWCKNLLKENNEMRSHLSLIPLQVQGHIEDLLAKSYGNHNSSHDILDDWGDNDLEKVLGSLCSVISDDDVMSHQNLASQKKNISTTKMEIFATT